MRKKHLDMVGDAAPEPPYHFGFRIVFKLDAVFCGKRLKASGSGSFVPWFQIEGLKVIDGRAEACLMEYRFKADAA
jgi:hypothetical protein